MQAPIITLITDWGNRDFFAGMLKGKLYSQITNVRIVDITHNVEPYNIREATIVAQNACMNYPQGTIHIIDVATPSDGSQNLLCISYKGQYFLCADNGLPYVLFGDEYTAAAQLPVPEEGSTFVAYDLYADVAVKLAQDCPLSQLGNPVDGLLKMSITKTNSLGDKLSVMISHVDNYGNVHLHITRQQFDEIRKERPFVLNISRNSIATISKSYRESAGRPILVEGVGGYLQIALYQASAHQLLGLQCDSCVQFEFK